MSLLRAHTPRHAKPSTAAPVLALGGLTVALALGDGAASLGSAGAASASDFARLRACESGGNYRTDTGNGFYGAYQFDLRTWRGLGLSGLPSAASPGTQDAAAGRLQAARGWQPWPACSRRLGLGRSREQVSRSRPAASRRVAGVPAFAGRPLTVADVRTRRADVVTWQQRMAARGWDVTVDGLFGPQSAGVAARFAAEKGLRVAPAGTVDRTAWTAAWTLPVT